MASLKKVKDRKFHRIHRMTQRVALGASVVVAGCFLSGAAHAGGLSGGVPNLKISELHAGSGAAPLMRLVGGSQGLEIEGPHDRRGFYIGPMMGGGAYFAPGGLFPDFRLGLRLGGGVSKRLTLGLNAYMGKLSGNRLDAEIGWHGGANLEISVFLTDGFFLHGSAGVTGVPQGVEDRAIDLGFGGSAGIGYEFFLGMNSAMAVGIDYDLRANSKAELRHGPMLALSFSWY